MLQTIQKLAVAAVFGAFLAPAAFADGAAPNEHTIMVLDESFFPTVTYAQPGDVIHFVNASSAEQSIVAQDDNWSVGPIAVESEETFTVFADMQNDYFLVVPATETAEGSEEVAAPAGAISFSEAPLGD
jgi:plastocyanin